MTAPSNSHVRVRAIVCVLSLLASTTAVPQRSDLLSRLEAAEQRWKQAALENYAYEKPDSIEVSFDPEPGFPVSVAIDYRKRRSDDEFYFDVSNFVRGGD